MKPGAYAIRIPRIYYVGVVKKMRRCFHVKYFFLLFILATSFYFTCLFLPHLYISVSPGPVCHTRHFLLINSSCLPPSNLCVCVTCFPLPHCAFPASPACLSFIYLSSLSIPLSSVPLFCTSLPASPLHCDLYIPY